MADDFGCFRLVWTGLVLVMIKTAMISDCGTCQDDFYFRKWPVSPQGIIRTGQSVELECRVSAEDRISISWTLNGEQLINSSRRYQNATTGDLTIRRADHRFDSGDFACTATNVSSGFSIASQPATLMIHWIGHSTRINLESLTTGRHIVEDELSGLAQVDTGEDVALYCHAEGSGELQYDWFHNGRKIPKNKTKKLSLHSFSASESGTYTCSAKNGAGHSKSNVPSILTTVKSQLVRFTKDTVATVDSTVRLPCAFQPPANPVEWLFRGSLLGQTSQHTVESDGQLVISKINQQSEGWYHCRKSDGSTVEEYGSHLKVAFLHDFAKTAIDPPPPLSNGHHYYFAEYSTAELSCTAPDGLPPPTIWWEGPSGQVLTPPSEKTDSVLLLTRVLQEDAGTYRCRAGNIVRNVSIHVNLVVTSPPTIQQHPVSASVNEDETVSMSCAFSGSPAPATIVQWLKNGQPLTDPPKPVHGLRNSTLNFVAASKRHVGNYACRLRTIGHLPVDSQTATLHVREKLKFTVPPVAKSLELGTVRKVLCKAQGSPAPIVRWVKEDLKPLLTWPPHIEDINGTLIFHGVQDDDAGQYTCIATNSQGFISASVLINVTMSPHFTSLPNNVTFYKEGQKVELHCRANGHPFPTIQWDKDSVMDGFTSDRFSVNRNGTLIIENVQQADQGFYGCTAGNAGGFKRAEFRLVVQDWEYQYGDYEGAESITKTIIITLGAAAAYIFLSVGLLIWCRLKRRQRKLQSPNDGGNAEAQVADVQTALLTKEDQGENGRQSPAIDKLNVPSSAITKGALQGKGRFGDILEGLVTGLNDSEGTTRVLLRILATRDEDLIVEFRRQVDMLHRVRHANLVAVLGCCRDSPDVQMILMEYHQLFNLKSHLLSTSSSQPWSLAQIQSATLQIATGMNALAQKRFVHRDLGTRNILVGFHGKDNQRISLKIGSFGMDKEPFNKDYFVFKHQPIALRWLPHEAVLEDEYSTKSDVWMFAVTIWELYNAAQQPLSGHSDDVVLAELKKKGTLWDASFCKSNAMSSLLIKCWSHDPLLRPSFDELVHCAESAAVPTSSGESKTR